MGFVLRPCERTHAVPPGCSCCSVSCPVPHTQDINSIQELVDALSDAGDRLVIVVRYRACRFSLDRHPCTMHTLGQEPSAPGLFSVVGLI